MHLQYRLWNSQELMKSYIFFNLAQLLPIPLSFLRHSSLIRKGYKLPISDPLGPKSWHSVYKLQNCAKSIWASLHIPDLIMKIIQPAHFTSKALPVLHLGCSHQSAARYWYLCFQGQSEKRYCHQCVWVKLSWEEKALLQRHYFPPTFPNNKKDHTIVRYVKMTKKVKPSKFVLKIGILPNDFKQSTYLRR